ncbi:MAG: hypothetical protein ACYS9T_11365 [Planctomycetota bacterium]
MDGTHNGLTLDELVQKELETHLKTQAAQIEIVPATERLVTKMNRLAKMLESLAQEEIRDHAMNGPSNIRLVPASPRLSQKMTELAKIDKQT